MPRSETTAKLVTALAKAQSEFVPVAKTKEGQEGNRKFKYADLADVVSMVMPRLNKHGIFLSQPIVLEVDGEHVRQTTRLQLEEEFIQTDGIRLKDPSGAGKQLGAEVTYARRIDLNGLLGISPDDDLDAPDLKSDGVLTNRNQPKSASGNKGFNTTYPLLAKKNEEKPAEKKSESLEITDDDIPDLAFPVVLEEPLSPEASEVADHLIHFTPLTDRRNAEIQNRLKDLVNDKTLDRRKLAMFLEREHEGKKSIEVSADKWEQTIAKIEVAVTQGSDAVKSLLKT